jgi:hypothetical protein
MELSKTRKNPSMKVESLLSCGPDFDVSTINMTPRLINNTMPNKLNENLSNFARTPNNRTNAMEEDFTMVYIVSVMNLKLTFPAPISAADAREHGRICVM